MNVDMTDTAALQRLRAEPGGQALDVLYLNCASNRSPRSVDEAPDVEFVEVMVTNALTPMRTIAALGELVTVDGTIAVMSPEQGSVPRNDEEGFEV